MTKIKACYNIQNFQRHFEHSFVGPINSKVFYKYSQDTSASKITG